MSAASILEEQSGGDERIRIYREIRRLEKVGMTAKKAISAMMRGTYAARMKGVKPETWRRYYNDWKRHRVTPEAVGKTVDKNDLTVGKTVGKSSSTVGKSDLTVGKIVGKKFELSTNEKILSLLRINPQTTRDELARALNLSIRGIKYAIGTLKKAGRLRGIGGRKLGHWEVLGSADNQRIKRRNLL